MTDTERLRVSYDTVRRDLDNALVCLTDARYDHQQLRVQLEATLTHVSELEQKCGRLKVNAEHWENLAWQECDFARQLRQVAEERCPELTALSDWTDLIIGRTITKPDAA